MKLAHQLRRDGKLKPRTFFEVEDEEPTVEVMVILAVEEKVLLHTLATIELPASDLLRSIVV